MIKSIRDEADYEKALARVESLMDAVPNTDELEVLVTLIESYESKYYAITQ